MASLESTGSPPPRGRASASFIIHEEHQDKPATAGALNFTYAVRNDDSILGLANLGQSSNTKAPNTSLNPLLSSKLGNLQAKTSTEAGKKEGSSLNKTDPKADNQARVGDIECVQSKSLNSVASKLSDTYISAPEGRDHRISLPDEENQNPQDTSSAESTLLTPASDGHAAPHNSTERDTNTRSEAVELARLQRELYKAQDQIARQAQEISTNRATHQNMAPAPVPEFHPQPGSLANPRPYTSYARHFTTLNDDVKSELSDVTSPTTDWSVVSRPNLAYAPAPDPWGFPTRNFNQRQGAMAVHDGPPQQRNYSVPISPIGSSMGRGIQAPSAPNFGRNYGYPGYGGRGAYMMYPNGGATAYNNVIPTPGMPAMGNNQGYQPQPIGTPLSAAANTFNPGQGPQALNPWNAGPSASTEQTYVTPMEPLNYRRLLDRSVSCNWKYIVDKIVCNNDQQASIFLQQKLKVATVEQKFEIVESIIAQAYPLMVNRFGNFLIQRCFEHGTPTQVTAIANAIRGNTLSLSMDPFGCHVVQKAFDSVPEEYKAIMTHELLRRIPETIIHRYACHVWQKLFELRWADSPPQIMKFVNEALRGMWHEVALGETGSLVVQNIFENCLEEDKRPCLSEVLHNIDIVAHGQFGNWCIQHICEHGAPADRSRAVEHILRYATEYSMDQFASKVVEKCLKIGGNEFLERYLERICEGRPDRPRMPLIDIASDQYGNYLIQWILMHCDGTNRDIVASQIRKHMVSLRGSKFGSRVAMLCSTPAYGNPTTASVPNANRFSSAPAHTARYAGAYR